MKLRLFLFLAIFFIPFACGVPPENTSVPANRETLPIDQSTNISTPPDSTMTTARQRQPTSPLMAPSGPQPPIFTFSDPPILNKPVVVTVRFPPGIYPINNMDISVSVPDGFEVVETPEGVQLNNNAWVWKDGVYGVGRALVWEKDKEFKRDVPFEIKATIKAVKTGDFWMEARAVGPPQGVSVYVSSQIIYISVTKNGAEVSTRPPVRSAVPSRNEPPARGPAPGEPLPGRGTSITGHVYEADGKTPVADELVWYLQPSQIVDAKVISVTTDASGSYQISNVITHSGPARMRAGGKKYVLSEVKEVPVESGKGKWDWEISNIDFNLILGGSVAGHVYREDGRTLIPNARVVWQQGEGDKTPLVSVYDRTYSPQSVQTNADGAYVIGGLLTGGYRLHVVADGYPESYYNKGDYKGDVRLVSVVQGKETPGIDFIMIPFGSVSGYVYQDDGKTPIIGAEVNAGNLGQTLTDQNGAYIIGNLNAGRVILTVSTMGYVRNQQWVTIDWGKTAADVNFTLIRGGTISGRVYKEDGDTPVPNARVFWEQWEGEKTPLSPQDRMAFPRPPSVQTRTDGTYAIGGLLTGGYRLHVVADGYAQSYYNKGDYHGDIRLVSVALGKDTSGIDLILTPLGSISGHVYQADGKTPVAGCTVWVDTGGPLAETSTAKDGGYSVNNLRAGKVTVSVWAPGYFHTYDGGFYSIEEAKGVIVELGKNTANVDFSLVKGGSISGYVYKEDGKTPLEWALVQVLLQEEAKEPSGLGRYKMHPSWNRSVITGADGRYSFIGLITGIYKLSITAKDYVLAADEKSDYLSNSLLVKVTVGQDMTGLDFLMQPPGSISGRVYYADGQTPVEGAWVEAIPLKENNGPAGRSNTNGSYIIRNVLGKYRIKLTYFYQDQKIIQYYPNTNDGTMSKAVAVYSGKDTAGIDFVMVLRPPPLR